MMTLAPSFSSKVSSVGWAESVKMPETIAEWVSPVPGSAFRKAMLMSVAAWLVGVRMT